MEVGTGTMGARDALRLEFMEYMEIKVNSPWKEDFTHEQSVAGLDDRWKVIGGSFRSLPISL